MNCESTQRMIYEAVDRALTSDERRLVDAHLSACERCRSESAVLDAMIETVETTPLSDPSEAFLSNVMDSLPAPRQSLSVPSLFIPRMVFAATLAAAALVWLYRAMFVEIVENLLPVQTVIDPVTTVVRDIQAYLQSQAGAVLARLPEQVSNSVDLGSMLLVVTTLAVGYVLVRVAEKLDVGGSRFEIGRRT